MRIKKMLDEAKEGSAAFEKAKEGSWASDLAGEVEDEKKQKEGIMSLIKKALSKIQAAYKLKIDNPGGEDDSDHKKNSGDGIVKPGADPSEANVQKKTNMAWSPKDAVEMYKIGKPYDKFRLWNPLEDSTFFSYVVDKVKRLIKQDSPGTDISLVTDSNVKLAFESIHDPKDAMALYESFMATISKGQTIKLKTLLKD